MRILSRYFLVEFFKIFGICQISIYTIFLLIDFIRKIDNFIEAEVSRGIILSYFLYKTPFIIVQMTPVASLLSVIILFCLMKRSNEITALRACGFSVFQISKPIIMASLCIALGVFLFSETLIPYTSSKSNEIWAIKVKKRDPTRFYGNSQIWYKAEDAIYWIRHFDTKQKTLESPSFCFFDKAFRLVKRIDAQRCVWDGSGWNAKDGIIQELDGEGGYTLEKFAQLDVDIPETPEIFMRTEKKPEEMSYWQLKAYAKMVRQEGYDDSRYQVDMHVKFALPLVSLILVFTGIPVALGMQRGGTPLAVSAGMGICLAYLLVLGFSRSLGLSGVLPPFLSAWIASFLFLLLGVYFMMKIEK